MPFPHDAYLSRLTALRDQLRVGLSGAPPGPDAEPGPSVSELAAQIKALKAANTIEATPARAHKRHIAAEEPVTARIRRLTKAIHDPENGQSQEGASPDVTSHQDRIMQERGSGRGVS
jgi:hypothetical protein